MAIDDPVQPDEGQGGESGGGTPWDSYLDRFPEEARDTAAEVFREFDGNTTRRFQEAAEYRKQWEPYEGLGVNQRDPGDVQWGLTFVDALNDPQAIKQWYENYAASNGLTPQEQAAQDQPYVDPDTQSYLESQLNSQLGPLAEQMNQFREWQEQQEYQARLSEAQARIDSQLSELEKEPGYNREILDRFVDAYVQDDPEHAVERGWQDLQNWRTQLENDWVKSKESTPPAAEHGGSADSTPPDNNRWGLSEAKEMALKMMRESRG